MCEASSVEARERRKCPPSQPQTQRIADQVSQDIRTFSYDTSADKFIPSDTTTGSLTDSRPRHAGLSLSVLLPSRPCRSQRTTRDTCRPPPQLLIIAKPARILKRCVCNVELGFFASWLEQQSLWKGLFFLSFWLFRFSSCFLTSFLLFSLRLPPRLHGWDSHAHTVFFFLLFFPFLIRSCRAASLVSIFLFMLL